ncbi:Manganese/iron superoxide dismutase [Lipomyces kononenkoae]|uniref:Manganese/iron superoxide dismutase n=1 Tax=Lipomyces kononenkoae TaxID=34357 RepID=A0ACC3T0Y2_LIPKO
MAMSSLLRTSAARRAMTSVRSSPAVFARGKATLPDLDYDFGALEPYISGEIMELHYTKHHQTYVNSYNVAVEKFESTSDVKAKVELQSLINFHGGGHLNHSLFWKNLAPRSSGGGELLESKSPLTKAIQGKYGSYDQLISAINTQVRAFTFQRVMTFC